MDFSNIITLTTDMGLKDYYVGAIKGFLLSHNSSAQVIDISHEIKPFDVAHAAFVISNCFRDFPEGTIHIIGVNPEEREDQPHIIVEFKKHFFIGADNGLFSLLFGIDRPDKIFKITSSNNEDNSVFPTKNIFAKCAVDLLNGSKLDTLGTAVDTVKRRQTLKPVLEENLIKGTVSYIDGYGNIITNITRDDYENVGNGRDFTIYLTRPGYNISKINSKYSDVPEGEKVALFGSSGFLEIAIHKGVEGSGGGASKLFGIKLNDTITVEFKKLGNLNDY